jgi:arylsulfatase A-like enzyme
LSAGRPSVFVGVGIAEALLGFALRFGLCASLAWLFALGFELLDARSWADAPSQLGYLSTLAVTYSLLWLPAVALGHAVRGCFRRWRLLGDVALCILFAGALAIPSWRCAELLTGGTGMLDAPDTLPLQIAFTLVLVAGYFAAWLFHLAVCVAATPAWIARRSPSFQRWIARTGLVLTIGSVFGFAYAADEELRAYNFLVAFVMPAVWLAAASAVYAATMRSADQWTWTVLFVALVVGPLAYSQTHRGPALRAKAELIRRGGLIALSEAALQFSPPPRFANLTVSAASTARFDCALPPREDQPTALSTPADKRRNVIWISVDALRKDAVGPRTPALADFAARSLVFERAITPYPATLFALGAVLTGAHPSELLLAPASLPDVLQLTAASWDTRIAVWPDVLWFRRSALPGLITRNLTPTLAAGAERQTSELVSRLRAARAARQRTFAWIHYYEPHMSQERNARELGNTPRALYEALVHSVDTQIGKLISELERLGYFDDSLITVFGDHGEALGELGYYGHHVYLNQFIGDIPLIVYAPGLAPERSDRLASLTDLAPTLLEWAGKPATELQGDARSLFEVARSTGERYGLSEAFPVRGKLLFDLVREPITSRAALDARLSLVRRGTADYQPKVALVGSHARLIVNRVTGDEEFYDRETDPLEQRDLSDRGLPSHARMRSELRRAMQRMSERIYCRVAALAEPAGATAGP